MYFAIKSLYQNTKACVRINNSCTDWFASGVRQGDNLSPSLFAILINNLFADIDCLKRGIYVNGRHISILFYADDIVIIANSIILNKVNVWCEKWLLYINDCKSKIIHFRKKIKLKQILRY